MVDTQRSLLRERTPGPLTLVPMGRFSHNDYDVIQPEAELSFCRPSSCRQGRYLMDCAVRPRSFGLMLTIAVACLVGAVRAKEPAIKPAPKKDAGAEAPPEN